VLMTGVRDGQVHYLNPWGSRESMPIDVAKRYLRSIALESTYNPLDDTNAARLFSTGLQETVDGAHGLDPLKVGAGIPMLVGGTAGQVVTAGGKYTEQGGDAAIDWARRKWHTGNTLEKVAAIPAIAGGSVVKVGGLAVKKAGAAASWTAQKSGEALAAVGDAARAGATKIKQVFSGW